jgi:hypothetical protein
VKWTPGWTPEEESGGFPGCKCMKGFGRAAGI